ncbi:MAG: EAL domain-containing protein [Bacillota bacterium]
MIKNKDAGRVQSNPGYLQAQGKDFSHIKKRNNPEKEAMKIIGIYLLLGFLWISLSDKLLGIFVQDLDTLSVIQLYKGWFYVATTGVIFYLIILDKLKLFKTATDEIHSTYNQLAASHLELLDMEAKLKNLAYYDPLTKLPNKYFLKETGEELIQNVKEENKKVALLYIDLDDFKNINETMGHELGDKLIEHIARSLLKVIEPPHLVASLGGDEFGVLLLDINYNQLEKKIQQLLEQIREPWIINEHSFFVTISIGVAICPDHGCNFSTLLQNADTALSHIKERGKDGYSLFTQELKDRAWNFVQMDNQLRTALQKQEFQLYYQPQLDLKNNKIIGVEALIRWYHPQQGFIPPMEFIPFAEKTGHIDKISKWVFETACLQKQTWNQLSYRSLKIAINLSGQMLAFKDLVAETHRIMIEMGISEYELEFELTETALLADFKKSVLVLNELKELGLTIALDDFGTGYSSLTYLKELPIDIIKIDRNFISGIGESAKEADILKYIIDLAHSLNLKVVAEGVETKEQVGFLRKNNCDMVQGFYFFRPETAEEVEKYFSGE